MTPRFAGIIENLNAHVGEYVSKVGGDEMQGPLHITNNPDAGGSRDSRRIETLGVFSGSDNSALRLGTNRDRVYVGNNDTSFNGPIKVDEIHEKNSNHGVVFKNAISMSQHKITKLFDPENDEDAVNLRTVQAKVAEVEGKIKDRLDELIVDNSAGTMKYMMRQNPMSDGEFNCWTLNGSQSTTDPMQTKELWIYENNLYGYPFNWDEVRPNSYFYMSGPNGALIRYKVINTIYVTSSNYYRIQVSSPEVIPENYTWTNNDEWEVIFRSFTGGDSNLDDFLRLDGSNKMKGNLSVDNNSVKDVNQLYFDGSGNATILFNAHPKIVLSEDRVLIKRGQTLDAVGFEIDGKIGSSSHKPLFYAYHNKSSITDGMHYKGAMNEDSHIVTVGHVRSTMRNAFSTLQRAVADEDTVEGIRTALTNALGGLIEELEHND